MKLNKYNFTFEVIVNSITNKVPVSFRVFNAYNLKYEPQNYPLLFLKDAYIFIIKHET